MTSLVDRLRGKDGTWDTVRGIRDEAADELERLQAEVHAWVNDLQSGLFINCVYCGHQYGPGTAEIPREALERHIAECPEHPLRTAREVARQIWNAHFDVTPRGPILKEHPWLEGSSDGE